MASIDEHFQLSDAAASGRLSAIGASAAMQTLFSLAKRVAGTARPALITGPSGSGKEVIAQLMHRWGAGAEAPFIDVNCGAIPESLIEAEMFGSVKGSFTGATGNRLGYFESAAGGTLFLDEIGELPLSLQPKLLRVLETRLFRPVGSSDTRRFEGRILAATHRDLPAMVKQGTFREDLYYRLAVFVLQVPGLEQRRDDIPALLQHFLAAQPRRLTFTPAAIEQLRSRDWPGHVRELRNFIDRVAVLSDATVINAEALAQHLPLHAAPSIDHGALGRSLMRLGGEDKLAFAERLLIDYALDQSDGNKTAAARLLGVSRKTIERRVGSKENKLRQARQCVTQASKLADNGEFRDAIPLL